MPKKFDVNELARANAFGERIALLVKILDMRDASMLLAAYRLYPKEIEEDYGRIAKAAQEGRFEDVFGLLDWYKYKALNDAAGTKCEGLSPKEQLSILMRELERARKEPAHSSKLFAEKLD